MCKHGTSTGVPTPDWAWDTRSFPENGIAIDSCIVGDILTLWKHGVYTLGSCCGHGKDFPSIVLAEEEHVDKARELVPNFTLYLWKLVNVGDALEGAVKAIDKVFSTHQNRIFMRDTAALMTARETLRMLQESGID